MQPIPSAQEQSRVRARIYGLRMADDPKHIARFAVVCPQHKIVNDDLTIEQARVLLEAHFDEKHA